jgi:hypothetical protein
MPNRPTLLVKMRPGAAAGALPLNGAQAAVSLRPLFASIGRGNGLGAAPAAVWHVVTPNDDAMSGQNPWDLCHALLESGMGIAARPEMAEPDVTQQWLCADDTGRGMALARTCDTKVEQLADFPRNSDVMWFREDGYAQFASALQRIADPSDADRVRIAHLDTGYDPGQEGLPKRLNHALERNFVDDGREHDASDDTSGVLNNRGHGTGTMGILAGSRPDTGEPLGGAPFADIVPVRVANRVVLFSTRSIAQAFDYVHGLCADPGTRVHVITMSMGGLASQAWADAVNALYDRGVFVVTAAGNNFGNLPTRNIVYPARFKRVVAACGVMADHAPYTDLGIRRMAGNYGPPSKVATAIAACTPNMPWLRLGCSKAIDFDGQGTSSATPQVAAAAALWIQLHKAKWQGYPEDWMRVEAVRKALFDSAAAPADKLRLGRGELRALDALNHLPTDLAREAPDSACFPLLRVLTGLGIQAQDPAAQKMLELEALQLSQSAEIEQVLPDPEADPASLDKRRVRDALASQRATSQRLRAALGGAEKLQRPAVPVPENLESVAKLHLEHAISPALPKPEVRRLRAFAYDPSLAADVDTFEVDVTTLEVRFEALGPGPVGEYLEVVDVDPASGSCYAPVDLDAPHLLAQDGLVPTESNPQFHQQMAYAVAMRTIEAFERALGRRALWAGRPKRNAKGREVGADYVQRLRIYPHALREANAYYSPDKKALLLGYFTAQSNGGSDQLPGGVVFSAVSHDIVAHETTHALLDGLHRYFGEATNRDSLGFHEAFADIVALFQHFSLADSLRHQIRRTRGSLEQESLLSQLAVQFGHAAGRGRMALRDAIGRENPETGAWEPAEVSPAAYRDTTEPHARGAILVATVFSAFLRIYRMRRDDLLRLATNGTGVLPPGDIPLALADRLAEEASKIASHVLNMCIRALDYCPPVDVNFGEYLRALITADRDLVPNDRRGYRIAFVAAFRERGIYPPDVKNLSTETLVWEPPPVALPGIGEIAGQLWLAWDMRTDRKEAWKHSRENAKHFQQWLLSPSVSDDDRDALGITKNAGDWTLDLAAGALVPGRHPERGLVGELEPVWVHSVRPARRVGPDGQSQSDIVVNITQTFYPEGGDAIPYRGGCTLLIDKEKAISRGEGAREAMRYFVRKRIASADRLEQRRSLRAMLEDEYPNPYIRPLDSGEPFAFVHRH